MLTTIGCATASLAFALVVRAPVALDGPLLDVLIGARGAVTGSRAPDSRAAVAVIAVDQQSLDSAELLRYPRVLFAPVWGRLIDTLATAGVRAIGFDFLFTYSASQLSPDHDRPFLAALAAHRDLVVLARSSRSVPAPPFLAALDPDDHSLGLAELVADADGVHRYVRRAYRDESGEVVPSLAGALLGRARLGPMPETVLLTPRAAPEAIPTYAIADVLRCAATAPAALAEALSGRMVLVGTTLVDEDRKLSSARFLPAVRDRPLAHPCGLHRLGSSSATSASVPGVHLHALAVDAVARGRLTSTVPDRKSVV